jgi:hypothetical protein
MPAMRTPQVPLLLISALVGGLLGGCRTDDADCVALAEHVVALASAEGRPIVGTATAIEDDCKRLRPTATLAQCMMDARSLAELDAC